MREFPNPLTLGLPTSTGIVLIGTIFYITFTMGTLAGGSVALNESEQYAEERHKLAQMDNDLENDLESNYSGVSKHIALGMTVPMVKGATWSATAGFDAGHAYPDLAKAHGSVAEFIAIVPMGIVVYRSIMRVTGGLA